jgi:hypothetical protein
MKDKISRSNYGALAVLIIPFVVILASALIGGKIGNNDRGVYIGVGIGVAGGAVLFYYILKWFRN